MIRTAYGLPLPGCALRRPRSSTGVLTSSLPDRILSRSSPFVHYLVWYILVCNSLDTRFFVAITAFASRTSSSPAVTLFFRDSLVSRANVQTPHSMCTGTQQFQSPQIYSTRHFFFVPTNAGYASPLNISVRIRYLFLVFRTDVTNVLLQCGASPVSSQLLFYSFFLPLFPRNVYAYRVPWKHYTAPRFSTRVLDSDDRLTDGRPWYCFHMVTTSTTFRTVRIRRVLLSLPARVFEWFSSNFVELGRKISRPNRWRKTVGR